MICLDDDVLRWIEDLSKSYSLIFFGQDINLDFWISPLSNLAEGYALYNSFSVDPKIV